MCERGAEYWIDGEIKFPEPRSEAFVKFDGTYRSNFGPCILHAGVIYANTNHNVSLALRRITATREPHLPGRHRQLQALQRQFVRRHLSTVRKYSAAYAPHFENYTDTVEEARLHHADPHVKKALRVQAHRELVETGTINKRLWLKKVLYKMKKDEIAKPGKIPRMIGDLGVAASLQGFRLTKYLKDAMASEVIHIHQGAIQFCPTPSPDALATVFQKLIDPPGRFYFVYFSDDACLSVRGPTGRVRTYNLDISKCDASHTEHIWMALREMLPERVVPDYDILVDQLKLPIEIRDVNAPYRSVILRPDGPRLYSGSTLTTVTNNVANQLIALSIAESRASTPEEITEAAAQCGYIVTLQECHRMYDIQFLKHSPVYDTRGRLRALLNLGVLLRLSGTCKGDLPGRGDLTERAREFQYGLLNGAYPNVSFALIEGMKNATRRPDVRSSIIDTVRKTLQYTTDSTSEHYSVSDVEVYARYSVDQPAVDQLNAVLSSFSTGLAFSNSATAAILYADYGLETTFL